VSDPPTPPARRSVQWRVPALVGVAACLVGATLAVLVLRHGGGAGGAAASGDLGDQSDGVAVATAVQAALARLGDKAPPKEPGAVCASETRETYGRGLGSLVYTVRLRWQGVPAVALAYQAAGPTANATASGTGTGSAGAAAIHHRVFVVSTNGCRLLVAQGL